ncbi:MAG TPA: hypothetical protein VMS98_11140 [Thermoanaerobaculia bacterium]|nr:hypothetical protein [Thermoanaerobaculia bacterium]
MDIERIATEGLRSALRLFGVDEAQWGERDDRPWWDGIAATLTQLAARRELRLVDDPAFVLLRASGLSDRGASPAFLLTGRDGSRRKMRLCATSAVRDRMLRFLRIVEDGGWPHCARLVSAMGTAIVKTFIEGAPLSTIHPTHRPMVIEKIARALATLHALPHRPVVCGADDYNVVVTPAEGVAMVDLEAVDFGSRWRDLAWSQALLCRDANERASLWSAYVLAAGVPAPSIREQQDAERDYLRWLLVQIDVALVTRPDHSGLKQDRASLVERLHD